MKALCVAAVTCLTLALASNMESKICTELPKRSAVVCKCVSDTQGLEEPSYEHTFENIEALSFENCASVTVTANTFEKSNILKHITFSDINRLSFGYNLPRTLENLTITNTNVTELSPNSFSSKPHVKSFQIKDSWIVRIEPLTFLSTNFNHVEFNNVTFQNLSQNSLQLKGDKVVIQHCTFLSPEAGSIQINSTETTLSTNIFYNLNNRTLEILSNRQCRPSTLPYENRTNSRTAPSKDNCNHIMENAYICDKGANCSSNYSGFSDVCQVNSSNICQYKKSSFLKTFGIKPSRCSESQERPICELYIISAANILSFHAVVCLLTFVIYIFNL